MNKIRDLSNAAEYPGLVRMVRFCKAPGAASNETVAFLQSLLWS